MYDAWQAQQRAQKEEERKAKTDAAAALQGYRRSNLSEEETKLAALREQERIQKLNAEQQLHGYRGKLSEEESKLAAQKQEELRKKQEFESKLRHNGVVSANDDRNIPDNLSGAVSALAAGYSSPSPVKRTPQEYDEQQRMTPSSLPSSSSNENIPQQPDFSSCARSRQNLRFRHVVGLIFGQQVFMRTIIWMSDGRTSLRCFCSLLNLARK